MTPAWIENAAAFVENPDLADRLADVLSLLGDREGVPELMEYAIDNGFLTSPASTKHHLACEGGLLAHSLNVAEALVCYAGGTRAFSVESAALVGLFHDLCKAGLYPEDEDGAYGFDAELAERGHGELSRERVAAFVRLSDEEGASIEWHMGQYDRRIRRARSSAARKEAQAALEEAGGRWPMVSMAHVADMWASQVAEWGR